MGLQLLGLAPELVEGVVKQVGSKKDLGNIRLVCKTLDKFASKELFREVVLSQRKRHLESWNAIAQSENLRHVPRRVVIEPRPGDGDGGGFESEEDAASEEGNDGVNDDEENDDEENDDGESQDEENSDEESDDEEYGDELKKMSRVIKALSRFPNVDSLEIVFTKECLGKEDNWYGDVEESAEFRESALQMILRAIYTRSSDDRTVRKLTIINLQNCEYNDLVASRDFRSVMRHLEELHVGVIQEYNEHGPDHDFTKEELRTFPAHFCQAWLAPISANLKALTIYQHDQNWGPFPGYFQPIGISFPKLEKLVLQYYTLAHDNDLDWVLSIKSLRKLYLHKCMIASKIRINTENMTEWNVRTHDWKPAGKDEWYADFSYDGKWSTFIDRLHESLPDLREFRFNYGDAFGDRMHTDERHDASVNKMFSKRYVTFDNGILPTHWPEARNGGNMYQWTEDEKWPNLHEEYLDVDQASMDRITSRRR